MCTETKKKKVSAKVKKITFKWPKFLKNEQMVLK